MVTEAEWKRRAEVARVNVLGHYGIQSSSAVEIESSPKAVCKVPVRWFVGIAAISQQISRN